MGLSRKHLADNAVPVHFNVGRLAEALKRELPEVDFCFHMGSAMDGMVNLRGIESGWAFG
jgi:hypothetical protein